MQPNRRQTSSVILAILVVLAIGLLLYVLWPLASSLFLAGVLAGAFSPLFERLTRKLKGRRNFAALLMTFGVVLAVIIPTGTLGAVAVKEAIDGVNYISKTLRSEGGVSKLIDRLPGPLRPLGQRVVDALPHDGQEAIAISGAQGATAVSAVGNILSATTNALVQTVFMLIAFYFLLTDGPRLVRWLTDVVPLAPGQLKQLLEDFRKVSVAVLLSTVATGAVQTVAAGVGYLITRVPNLLFFTLATFFMSLVPAVGAASVSVLLAGLLFISGRPLWQPILLLAWGFFVVGLIDNLVKPLFIKGGKGGLELHGAVVFFALIGGLAAFGAIGLLAGPLIVAFFLATVRMAQRDVSTASPPPVG